MVSLVHSKPEAPFGTRTVAGSGLGGAGGGWLADPSLPLFTVKASLSGPEQCA